MTAATYAPAPRGPRVALSRALAAGTAAGVVAVAGALDLHRPATLCLLRAATGVPCPLCGTTTALARLVGGDVVGALAANPVSLLAGLMLVLAPLVAFRVPQRALMPLLTVIALFAWVWQLARFDLLPV